MSLPVLQAIGPEGFGTYSVDFSDLTLEPSDRSAEGILVPGFVDIHIHGAFGLDFMSGSASDLLSMADGLRKIGYEAFLPTTVTASSSDVQRALGNLPSDDARIPGFHLEGPFISPKHPGAQPQEFIVQPSLEWEPVLSDPRLRNITVAPEMPGVHGLITRLSGTHTIVSMGHTDATYAQVEQAVAAGARHTTHTYNAMRPLHHREAGTVGAAMLLPLITCELIYDRIHVSKPAAELLFRAKGMDGVIAVSDATMAAGMPPGEEITMWGLQCVTGPGEVRLKDGTLAGSAITLYDAFRNLAQDFGVETAIRACSINPRRALGMGKAKVWVVMDPEYRIVEIRPSPHD
jgi:N-acetylglucosamine-6-phosphate deacetylase